VCIENSNLCRKSNIAKEKACLFWPKSCHILCQVTARLSFITRFVEKASNSAATGIEHFCGRTYLASP
jgi:hypothetical protein